MISSSSHSSSDKGKGPYWDMGSGTDRHSPQGYEWGFRMGFTSSYPTAAVAPSWCLRSWRQRERQGIGGKRNIGERKGRKERREVCSIGIDFPHRTTLLFFHRSSELEERRGDQWQVLRLFFSQHLIWNTDQVNELYRTIFNLTGTR